MKILKMPKAVQKKGTKFAASIASVIKQGPKVGRAKGLTYNDGLNRYNRLDVREKYKIIEFMEKAYPKFCEIKEQQKRDPSAELMAFARWVLKQDGFPHPEANHQAVRRYWNDRSKIKHEIQAGFWSTAKTSRRGFWDRSGSQHHWKGFWCSPKLGYQLGSRARQNVPEFLRSIQDRVKTYFWDGRLKGYDITPQDLYVRYEFYIQERLKLLDLKQAYIHPNELPTSEQLQKARLVKILGLTGYARKSNIKRLQDHCRCQRASPGRATELTPSQEQVRLEEGWGHWDTVLHTMAHGTDQEKGKFVADVERWNKNLKDTVVIFSDQVPFYATTGATRSYIANFEIGRKKKVGHCKLKRSLNDFNRAGLKKRVDKARALLANGCRQKRSYTDKNQGKTRVCIELGVAVHHLFRGDGTVPVAELADPFLIMHGSPNRMAWIDQNGRYTKDHCFYDGDFLQWRSSGQACLSLKHFVADRAKHPEDYSKIQVATAHTATVNEISYSWILDHWRTKYPQFIEVRDCMSVPFTTGSKVRKFASQVVGAVIPPCCTDLVQIGDTDLHKQGKDSAMAEKIKIQRESLDMSSRDGTGAVVQNTARNIMRVARAFVDGCEIAIKQGAVIAGLRKSGYLSFFARS